MKEGESAVQKVDEQMVEVPAGNIVLKDERTKRTWAVELDSYCLGKYPITQGLYFEITGESPASSKGEDLPVESVSWVDAIKFCNRLSERAGLKKCYSISSDGEAPLFDRKADGYRLPLEAEWEYACRAESTIVRYGELDEIGWYRDNSDNRVHRVGQKKPNAWGIYDMIGNVWEWCWDIYDAEVYGSYRVFRGGGWFDPPRGCRTSCRRKSHPTYAIDDLGFRVARGVSGAGGGPEN